MRIWELGEWLPSGGVVIAVVVLGYSADAARRRSVMECEEWRDYYYNVETGTFVEWLGEPYWVCNFREENVSYPESPSPDRYDGGIPYADTRSKCKQCEALHDSCQHKVARGVKRCVNSQTQYYRGWCERHKRQRFDRPMGSNYECDTVESTNPVNGKPMKTKFCYGPSLDACVESYARNYPDTTQTNGLTLRLGTDYFGIGYEDSFSVSWGGVMGFVEACGEAGAQANGVCVSNLSQCEEKYGCGLDNE